MIHTLAMLPRWIEEFYHEQEVNRDNSNRSAEQSKSFPGLQPLKPLRIRRLNNACYFGMQQKPGDSMKPGGFAKPSPVMTLKELCAYLHAHPSTLYRLVRKGEIPFFKMATNTVSTENTSINGSLNRNGCRTAQNSAPAHEAPRDGAGSLYTTQGRTAE
ncbi:MAG: helix-turn-helix domain-containing protein [Candidatus Binataceae bacterium]